MSIINLFSLMATIGVDDSQFTQGMARAESSATSFSKNMKKVGTKITKITAPFAAMGTAAVKVGMDFNAGMSKVKAISGATGKDLKKLSDKAKEMGSKTSKSATEAAEALSFMALAGWDTTQSIDALEPVLRLSEAGGMDLAKTSDLVTDSMSSLGITTKELPGYLDKMAKTSGKSNTSVEQLGEAMVIAGGTFKSLNTPMDEANAILGIMANRGIKGSEAGNSLNSIMINLTTGAGEAGVAMDKLNINAFDGQGKFKGMGNVLKEVGAKTKDMTEEQKNMYLSMIGGKTQLTTLQALVSGTGEEFDGLQSDIKNSDGALNKMAKTMQDNLGGRITELKSALEGLMISLSDTLIPLVEKVVGKLQEWTDKFNALSPSMKDLIVKIGLVAIAIGPVLLVAAKMAATIGTIKKAMALLNIEKIKDTAATIYLMGLYAKDAIVKIASAAASKAVTIATKAQTAAQWLMNAAMTANPIGLVIAAITLLVAAIVVLWKKNETFRSFIIGVWDTIKSYFTELGPFFTELWDGIKKVFTDTWDSIAKFFTESIPKFIANIVKWLGELPGKIVTVLLNVIKTFIDWEADLIKWEIVAIPKFVKKIVEFIAKLPGKIRDELNKVDAKLAEWGTALINWAKKEIPKFIKKVVLFYAGMPGKIWAELTKAYNKVTTWGTNLISWTKVAMPKFVKKVISFYATMPGKTAAELVKVVTKITEWGKDITAEAGKWAKNMMKMFVKGIKDKVAAVGDAVSGVADKIKDFLGFHSPTKEGACSDSDTWAPNFIDMFTKGMDDNAHKVEESSDSLASKIKAGLDKVDGYVTTTVGTIEKEFKLWTLQNEAVEGSSGYLTEQLEMQREKHELLNGQIEATEEALRQVTEKYGEGSDEVAEYKNKLLDLKIAQGELTQSINKSIEAQKSFNIEMVKGGAHYGEHGEIIPDVPYSGMDGDKEPSGRYSSRIKETQAGLDTSIMSFGTKKQLMGKLSGDKKTYDYFLRAVDSFEDRVEEWKEGHWSRGITPAEKVMVIEYARKEQGGDTPSPAELLSAREDFFGGVPIPSSVKFHNGGWVGDVFRNISSKLKSDEVPAVLQKGEFVLSRDMISNLISMVSPKANKPQLATASPGMTVQNNMYGMDFSNYELTAQQVENSVERARWKIK